MLLENETAEEAFQRLLPADSDGSAYHSRLQKILQAQASIKKINDARQADGEEHKISKEDDEPQLMGEARAAMKELFDMNTNPADTLSLEQRVAMLNTDQRRVFDKVKAHFLHQKEHEATKCACNLTPLRMFVSGVGGTGKSFLIATIKSLVGHLWPTDDLTCRCCTNWLISFQRGWRHNPQALSVTCRARREDSWILGSVKTFPKGNENYTL